MTSTVESKSHGALWTALTQFTACAVLLFQGTAYPAAVECELGLRVANTPIGTPVYLAITPLNGGRDGLASNWGAAGAEPLMAPWDTRGFDSTEVIDAFSNFALDLVQRFQPSCLNFAIEVSELAINDPTGFKGFLTFEAAVAANLRAQHPELPLMVSVGLKSPGSADAQTIAASMPAAVAQVESLADGIQQPRPSLNVWDEERLKPIR